MYSFTIVPFLYFLKTRLKGNIQRVSWIFVYFIPNIFLYLYVTNFDLSIKNILSMIFGIVLINYIYENGYLQNDIILTQKEKNPTLRLTLQEMKIIYEDWYKIVFIRGIISLFFLTLFYFISSDILLTFGLFIVVLLLQILYLVYNSIRNIWNLILILPISYFRFYGFIIPFISISEVSYFVIITSFIYPISKFLEFTNQPRYNLKKIAWFVGNIDIFRIKYYFILTLVSLVVCIYIQNYFYFLIISFYYLVLRIGAFYMITNNKKIQEELLNNTKKVYRK